MREFFWPLRIYSTTYTVLVYVKYASWEIWFVIWYIFLKFNLTSNYDISFLKILWLMCEYNLENNLSVRLCNFLIFFWIVLYIWASLLLSLLFFLFIWFFFFPAQSLFFQLLLTNLFFKEFLALFLFILLLNSWIWLWGCYDILQFG